MIDAICQWCVASAVLMTLLLVVNAARAFAYAGAELAAALDRVVGGRPVSFRVHDGEPQGTEGAAARPSAWRARPMSRPPSAAGAWCSTAAPPPSWRSAPSRC